MKLKALMLVAVVLACTAAFSQSANNSVTVNQPAQLSLATQPSDHPLASAYERDQLLAQLTPDNAATNAAIQDYGKAMNDDSRGSSGCTACGEYCCPKGTQCCPNLKFHCAKVCILGSN